MRALCIAVVLICNSAWADSMTISADGINSKVTSLDGTDILIGQVEVGRPGDASYDMMTSNYASNTDPAGVYFRTSGGMDSRDSSNIVEHATFSAQVAIAKDHSVTGQQGNYGMWEGVR